MCFHVVIAVVLRCRRVEGSRSGYDRNDRTPSQTPQQDNDAPPPGQGEPTKLNLRDQLVRSRSRSLTDLVSLVNTTIEESPFENSSRTKLSMEASGASLQASGASLHSSIADLPTKDLQQQQKSYNRTHASEASKRSTATTDSNVTIESDSPTSG